MAILSKAWCVGYYHGLFGFDPDAFLWLVLETLLNIILNISFYIFPIIILPDSVVGFRYSSVSSYSWAMHSLHYFFTLISRWVTDYIILWLWLNRTRTPSVVQWQHDSMAHFLFSIPISFNSPRKLAKTVFMCFWVRERSTPELLLTGNAKWNLLPRLLHSSGDR